MILITGATGAIGDKVIEILLKTIPPNKIAGLARSEEKAADLSKKGVDVRMGEYDDKESLNRAMKGIEKVLLVSGGNAKNGLEQHQNVVDAAKKANVKCIAYTSRCMRDRNTLVNQLMKRHFATEDYIIESGLNYILFRNILYLDSVKFFVGENVFDTGISLPAGNGKASYALKNDMGEAIGNVLAGDDCSSRIYNFTGSRTYTFYDVAEALTELSGKNVTYTPVDADTFKIKAKERGLPDFAVDMVTNFMQDIQNGQEEKISDDMEIELGRKPLSLKEGLKVLFNL